VHRDADGSLPTPNSSRALALPASVRLAPLVCNRTPSALGACMREGGQSQLPFTAGSGCWRTQEVQVLLCCAGGGGRMSAHVNRERAAPAPAGSSSSAESLLVTATGGEPSRAPSSAHRCSLSLSLPLLKSTPPSVSARGGRRGPVEAGRRDSNSRAGGPLAETVSVDRPTLRSVSHGTGNSRMATGKDLLFPKTPGPTRTSHCSRSAERPPRPWRVIV